MGTVSPGTRCLTRRRRPDGAAIGAATMTGKVSMHPCPCNALARLRYCATAELPRAARQLYMRRGDLANALRKTPTPSALQQRNEPFLCMGSNPPNEL